MCGNENENATQNLDLSKEGQVKCWILIAPC